MIDKFKLFDALGYKVYHPDVRRFHESTAKIKVCCAPRRTTKSYSASYDVMNTVLMPNTRTWIVGPSYGLAEKEFRYIHEALVLKRDITGLPKPTVCLNNAKAGSLFMRFPWGAIVEGKSADRPDSLLGEAVDVVIYSEAAQLPRGIRERYVAPTLITRKGTEIVPTTPSAEAEWVYELFQCGQEGRFPEIQSFQWDITANPTYDQSEFEFARKTYGEESPVFREQYLGEWVFYGGLVYNTFSESTHIIEPFEIPRSWQIVRGIDFGHRDPFVCLWAAVGPQGELYITREYYSREGKSIREHASSIKGYSLKDNISRTVGDPSAKQLIDDLCFEGIICDSADNDRASGRIKMLEYLLPTTDGVPPFPLWNTVAEKLKEKYPRIYIFNTCKELIREFKFYRWKEGQSREGEKERTEGEDHAMDALRYLVQTRPSPFREKARIPAGSFLGWMNKIRADRMKSNYIGATAA